MGFLYHSHHRPSENSVSREKKGAFPNNGALVRRERIAAFPFNARGRIRNDFITILRALPVLLGSEIVEIFRSTQFSFKAAVSAL